MRAQVSFTKKKPLGLVLERSSEWAVVKLSNEDETRVTTGSVLYFINDEPVTLLPYPDTIARLTKWKPPLVLGLRRSPFKQGSVAAAAAAEHPCCKALSGLQQPLS